MPLVGKKKSPHYLDFHYFPSTKTEQNLSPNYVTTVYLTLFILYPIQGKYELFGGEERMTHVR